jgi:hypothetical protein
MSHLPDNERLLKDVLAEESAEGFREALLSETLRQARGRRRRRHVQRVGGIVVMLVAATLLIWRTLPGSRTQQLQRAVAPPPLNYQLILTQPTPATMLVESRQLPNGLVVSSFETARVISTTAKSGGFREIGDGELLALAPRPAALVRRSPHDAELILPKAADEDPPQF